MDVSYFEAKNSRVEDELPGATAVHSRPNFYLLPGTTSIAHTAAYRAGAILAIDSSSMLAVDNLDLQDTDHILDLCCAPGAKLTLMAKQAVAGGSVTGVDVSRERLAATVTMAKKYKLGNVRLFVADGTNFAVPVHLILDHNHLNSNIYQYARNAAPLWSSSAYRKQKGQLSGLYDKVLVDAQCTHDGSIKHIRNHIQSGWKYYDPQHFSPSGLDDLYELQYGLLCNGFRLLKQDGLLVYSTCSLSRLQNEAIIKRFMQSHAGLVKIEDPIGISNDQSMTLLSGTAARINPSLESGGGFFLCRIRKRLIR